MPAADWIDLRSEPLPVEEARLFVTEPRSGAVVVFCGTVRDHSDGIAGVTHLDYEAYEGPARAALAEVAAATRDRFPGVGRLALLHRLGRLALEEVAVVVAVAAPHRAEAFAASEWAIGRLKESVPIWKREEWAGGSRWVEGCPSPAPVEAAT